MALLITIINHDYHYKSQENSSDIYFSHLSLQTLYWNLDVGYDTKSGHIVHIIEKGVQ